MGLISRVPPGYYDITDTLTSPADYNGTNDVTVPLQNQIDYCRDNNLAVLFPRGTKYRVSDTIRSLKNDGVFWASPGKVQVLEGQQGGVPPQIVLPDATAGFASGNNKPVVHVLNTATPGQSYPPAGGEDPDRLYRAVFSGIDIDCGDNPGASGLLFDAAQESYCGHVTVTGVNFRSGIRGLPGHGVCSRNLSVVGNCQYGLEFTNPLTAERTGLGCALSALRIEGSTVSAISCGAARGALGISGVWIKTASGNAFTMSGYRYGEYGNLAIFDGVIELGSAGATAINAQYTGVALWRVYLKNASVIADHYQSARDYAGNASGWFYVERYKGGHDRADAAALSNAAGLPRRFRGVDNTISAAALVSANNATVTAGEVPNPQTFIDQHAYRTPDPTASDVIYATDTTSSLPCLADGTTDNVGRIQAKIDEAAAASVPVYFPPGTYKVSQTAVLPKNAKVLGAPGSRTRFSATAAWRTAILSAGVETRYFDTVDAADGRGELASITCDCLVDYYGASSQDTWLGFHRWRLGRNSVRAELFGTIKPSGRFDKPIAMVRVEGPGGGGRAWNCIAGGSIVTGTNASANFSLQFRQHVFSNVVEPTTLYAMDPEYGGAAPRTPQHAALVLFDNSSNVRVVAAKSEAWAHCVELANNSQVVFGVIGSMHGWDPTNVSPIGSVFVLDATSALDCGPISVMSGDSAGTAWLPNADTIPVVLEVPQVAPIVNQQQVMGGYERGSLLPVSTWDLSLTAEFLQQPWPTIERRRGPAIVTWGRDRDLVDYLNRVRAVGGVVEPDVVAALRRLFRWMKATGAWEALAVLQLFCTSSFTGVDVNQKGSPSPTFVGLSDKYTLRNGFTKTATASQRVITNFVAVDDQIWGYGVLAILPATISASFSAGGSSAVTPGTSFKLGVTYNAGSPQLLHEFGAFGASILTAAGTYARQTIYGAQRFSTTAMSAISDGRVWGRNAVAGPHVATGLPLWVGVNNYNGGEQSPTPIGTRICGYYITGALPNESIICALQDRLLAFLREIGRLA